jgi:hypothetical protein
MGGRGVEAVALGPVLAGFSIYKEVTMTSVDSTGRTIAGVSEPYPLDEAQLAAVAFLARYSGRTSLPIRLVASITSLPDSATP